MRETLENLFAGATLSSVEAARAVVGMARGEIAPAQVAAFLAVYRMRSLTLAELRGFRDGIFSLAKKVDLDAPEAIDVCGTGGDGKKSLNVSTAVAFVAAGAGVRVAKHGNHGVSSTCGSSTVLEHLGIAFSDDQSVLKRQLDRANICFLHAPLFHAALKNVAGIRKDLGVKTLFNNLGPLLNPASVRTQLLGVYSLELARLYKYYFQERSALVAIVHSADGFDEVSLSAPSHVIGVDSECVVTAADFGLPVQPEDAIASSGGVEENARALIDLLENRGAQGYRSVVVANSALAIRLSRPGLSLVDAAAAAAESISSGAAKRCYEMVRG